MQTKEITITGCKNCPCLQILEAKSKDENKFCCGLQSNKTMTIPYTICFQETKTPVFKPITPFWCPIKKESITIKFERI